MYRIITIYTIDGYTCFIIDDHIGYDHVFFYENLIQLKGSEIKLKYKLKRIIMIL